MPERLDGNAFAAALLPATAAAARRCHDLWGRPPTLAVVTAGDDPAQAGYVARKRSAAERAGVAVREVALGGTADAGAVARALAELGGDEGVDGIFCQLPLDGVRAGELAGVLAAIPVAKDVDGAGPEARAALVAGRDEVPSGGADRGGGRVPAWRPATPLAAVELLNRHGVPVRERSALVVGGHPDADAVAALLRIEGARVARVRPSRGLRAEGLPEKGGPPYDVVVAAGPLPDEPPPGLLADEVAMIDLGYAPVRPLLPASWIARARWHCPARGGLGPATIAVLLRQTADAALTGTPTDPA